MLFSSCGINLKIASKLEPVESHVIFSKDSIRAVVITDADSNDLDSLLKIVEKPLSYELLMIWFEPDLDSIQHQVMLFNLESHFAPLKSSYVFSNFSANNNEIIIEFSADTIELKNEYARIKTLASSSGFINHLFQADLPIPPVNFKISNILTYPCEGIGLPTKSSRLPNAPRKYRHGIHRGIDFFANWGTPVRAVANGVVIRSDLFYNESSLDFREFALKQAKSLKRTPSDIFNSVLLGRSVIIDHGFDLIQGYRSISIYAHLSQIDKHIIPGYKIKTGEFFGLTGNSGTNDSVTGTRKNAHLHWELILQDAKGEYYLGQGIKDKNVKDLLNDIFEQAK